MTYRWSRTKEDILACLGKPRFRSEVAELIQKSESVVSQSLNRLWQQGLVKRSRKRVKVSYVVSKPKVGKYWKKLAAHLWLRNDSPMMTASGVVTVELPSTERYTLKQGVKKVNVAFVECAAELRERGKADEARLLHSQVLEFFKGRETGAATTEVAAYFDVPISNVSGLLKKMRDKGLLERRGHFNPKLDKETPFRGQIKGYVYGLAGTDQARRRIQEGSGLYSPHAKGVYVEIEKDSKQRRITPYRKFIEDWKLGEYETQKVIEVLTRIYPDLTTIKIGPSAFIYDKKRLTPQDLESQIKRWKQRISKEKLEAGAIGAFHEAFAQKAIDLTMKGLKIKITFWRRVAGGKEHYDVRLSNGKQIDRVFQVDYYFRGRLLWTHYYPCEMKFYKGGIAPHFILEFIDKLRTSREFGEEVEYREGPQTLRVHVIKQNVYPIFISPYFKKDTYAVAKKYHVELLPTWILSKCAGEAIGKQVNIKTLFSQYMKKEGGPIDQFLKEAFTK